MSLRTPQGCGNLLATANRPTVGSCADIGQFKRALSALLVQRYPQAATRIEDELAEITRLLRS